MPYKFMYFQVRGRAQQIRYLLEDNALEYEDKLVSFEEWGKKIKPTMRFGQLPCLVDGDFEIVQSGAILRHLARKHKLYGANETEATNIDMIHEAMVDLREKLLKLIFTKESYEEAKKTFVDNLPSDMAKFEVLLKENNGGKGFFVGNAVSMADYCMYDVLTNTRAFAPTCLDKCPLLKAYIERMAARPNMAKYIKSDKYKSIMITISDRLK